MRAPEGAQAAAPDAAPPRRFAFPLLLSIGVIDSATRMGFLTYLPFLLAAKGASVQAIGLALTAVFAGGACGKLACAFIGARIGVFATVLLTELLTAVAIIALLPLPLTACYVLLPLLGIALNGTSSVLYGSVPLLVTPRAAHARLQHLLHRHDRLRRGLADPVRLPRRRHRRADDAGGGRRRRPADAAARRGAAAGADALGLALDRCVGFASSL